MYTSYHRNIFVSLLCGILFLSCASQVNAQVSTVWAVPFAADTNNNHEVFDMALDDSGNVVIAGKTWDSFQQDGFVAKISPGGTVLWWQTRGVSGWPSYFYTVAVDDSGNVYAAGDSQQAGHTMNVKYNPSGQVVWVDTLPPSAGVADNISPANGTILTLIDNENITIRKHSGNSLLWEIRNDTSIYLVKQIGLDSAGNIYVSGARVLSTSDVEFFVKKFSSSGSFIWEATYNPSAVGDNLDDLKVDPGGNVYISGHVYSPSSTAPDPDGFAVAKFDPSGGLAWSRLYNTDGVSARNTSVDVDSAGNVYVSGIFRASTFTDTKCLVIKYDPAGTLLWETPLDSATSSNLPVDNMTLDRQGNVYVTYAKRTSGAYCYRTCRLSPANGNVVWQIDYEGVWAGDERPKMLLVDSAANVYVSGYEDKSSGSYATTVKYAQSVGIGTIANDNSALLIFPNPASEGFYVKSSRSFNSARLQVYNNLGQIVVDYQNVQGKMFEVDTDHLLPGMYFIQITDVNGSYCNKIIIE